MTRSAVVGALLKAAVDMDPVVFTADVSKDVKSLVGKDDVAIRELAARAIRVALEGEGELATSAGQDVSNEVASSRGLSTTDDERRGVRALAWVFMESLRACLTRETFEKKCAGFGFASDASAVLGETYASAAFKDAFTRAMSNANATNRGIRYDGLNWRLDVRVASRALHVEADPKYLLKLGRRQVDGLGGVAETVSTFVETDYQTLNAMREECEKALAACSSAHASRLARYVRRPKT